MARLAGKVAFIAGGGGVAAFSDHQLLQRRLVGVRRAPASVLGLQHRLLHLRASAGVVLRGSDEAGGKVTVIGRATEERFVARNRSSQNRSSG
jgi:hypothetical protein